MLSWFDPGLYLCKSPQPVHLEGDKQIVVARESRAPQCVKITPCLSLQSSFEHFVYLSKIFNFLVRIIWISSGGFSWENVMGNLKIEWSASLCMLILALFSPAVLPAGKFFDSYCSEEPAPCWWVKRKVSGSAPLVYSSLSDKRHRTRLSYRSAFLNMK